MSFVDRFSINELAEFVISDKSIRELIDFESERKEVRCEGEKVTAGEIVFEATNYDYTPDNQIPLKEFVKMLKNAGVEEVQAAWIKSDSTYQATIVCTTNTRRPETDDEVVERIMGELSDRIERYKQFKELEKEFG